MKLIVFGDALTYPPKEGITAHVFALLHSLAGTEVQPVLVLADRGFISVESLAALPWKTILLPPDTFYDYQAMEQLLDSEKPAVLQSYSVYQARLIAGPYSLSRQVPLVMEHHDLEAALTEFLGLDRSISIANQQAQAEVADMASLNRVMSIDDYQVLISHVPEERRANYIHLPVGLSDAYKDAKWPTRSPRDVVFVGNCAYPPNRQAADYIIRQLAPALPEFTFHLIGRLTDELPATDVSNVVGHGMVDDLAPLLASALCGVVPISVGSGMKIKVLTYLSAGLPVVGTPTAFQGYASADCLMEVSLADFPAALQRLAQDDQAELSPVARRLFLEKYEADGISKRLINAYKQVTFSPAPNAGALQLIERDDARLAWIHELRENVYPLVTEPKVVGGAA